jgi:hypothetical protein
MNSGRWIAGRPRPAGRARRPSLHLPHRHLNELSSQVVHVDVGSQPDVVGEVPTDVIGVIVNDDVVRIPQPSVTETHVVRRYREEEAAEPEASRTASSQVPDVAPAETTGEAAMLPRMIQMVVSVVAARIMAYPLFTSIDVRSIWVSFLFVEVAVFLRWMRSSNTGGTVGRNVLTSAAYLRPATSACVAAVLGYG